MPRECGEGTAHEPVLGQELELSLLSEGVHQGLEGIKVPVAKAVAIDGRHLREPPSVARCLVVDPGASRTELNRRDQLHDALEDSPPTA